MKGQEQMESFAEEAPGGDGEATDEVAVSYKARIVSRMASPDRRFLAQNLGVEDLDFILPRLLEVYLEIVESQKLWHGARSAVP